MLAKTPFRARSLVGSLCALLISVLATFVLHPGAAQAAAPGAVADLTWGDSRAEVDRTVSLLQASGVRRVRMGVDWSAGEQNGKGSYNSGYFSDVDYAVSKARAAGMDIVMPVDAVPYWASADPSKSVDSGGAKRWRKLYRPGSFQDYADFFRYVVERYKGRGVHTFQVWNEPNLERFWQSGVNPGEYTQMLKAAYPAIKAADPSARVLLGGLSARSAAYDFMQSVYNAGGGAYFDSAAYHVYPNGDPAKCWKGADGRPAFDSFCTLDEFRRIMVANGDAAKDVWITEYGFSTCSNSASACYGVGVTETQQAAYLVKLQQKLDSAAYSYVTAAFLYQFRDYTGDGSITGGDWEENLGVLRRDFTPKPSYAAFKAYNTGGRTSATPRRTRSRTSLSIASKASAAVKRSATGVRAIAAAGRVKGARRGQVRIVLSRYDPRTSRWVKAKTARSTVDARGGYRATLPLASGSWRAQTTYLGKPRSQSKVIPFRV